MSGHPNAKTWNQWLCADCHQIVSEPHKCPAVNRQVEVEQRIAKALERIAACMEAEHA